MMRKKIFGILVFLLLIITILTVDTSTTDAKEISMASKNDIIEYINGDWDVTGTEIRSNETIILTGNLTIYSGGNLTFHNITLKINCSFDGQYHIEVQDGGRLYIYDNDNNNKTTSDATVITANNTSNHYLFWVRDNATMIMKNSEIHHCGWDTSGWNNNGLYIESDNVTIDRCLITEGGSAGILIFSSSPIITNSTITLNPSWNILCQHASPKIIRNIISKGYIGIQCQYNSLPLIKDNTLLLMEDDNIAIFSSSNPTIINTSMIGGNYGIADVGGDPSYPIVINSTIKDTNYWDISLSMMHLLCLNTTFNKTNVRYPGADATLTVKWYLNIYVNINGDAIPDADVMVRNMTNTEVYNGVTSSDGWLKWIPCTEYVQTQSSTTYHTPYNITVIKEGYTTGYVDVTLNESKEIIVTLEKQPDVTPPVIIDHAPIGENVPLTSHIFVTFNETMNQTSVENAFIVFPDVDGTFTWDDNTMILTPIVNLSYDTVYNITVTTDAKDIAGNYLESNYSWEFITEKEPDAHPPIITNVQATPISQEVGRCVNITCTVTDNTGVDFVKINITGPAGFTPMNTSMIRIVGTDNYYYNVSYSILGMYYYYIWANDTSNNQNKSLVFQFQIYALNHLPNANFTFSPSSPTTSDTIQFIDLSNDSDGNISSWYWVFGDNTVSTVQNPTHQYSTSGVYTVILTVIDNDGAGNTASQTITVLNQQPIVVITSPSSGATVKNTVMVTGTSNDPDGSIVKVEIKIDNGNWQTVSGTTSWTYPWNTKNVPNGQHTISVRSYDGTDYSNVESVTVNVNNTQDSGGFIPGFECLLLIGAFIITVLLCYEKKKRIYGGR